MRQRDTTSLSLASDDGFLLKLELHSDPRLLCVVRGALERLTEVFGFSPPDRRSVTRAVDEALTNIMRHCYNGRTDQPIEVYCTRVPARGSQPRMAWKFCYAIRVPPLTLPSQAAAALTKSSRAVSVCILFVRAWIVSNIAALATRMSFGWSSTSSHRRSRERLDLPKEDFQADFRAAFR